jgi:hypothetical protein
MAVEWWAGYHRSFNWDEFPEACYLKDHLLTLPIHQDLGVTQMKYIGRCVNEIAAGMGSVEAEHSLSQTTAAVQAPFSFEPVTKGA